MELRRWLPTTPRPTWIGRDHDLVSLRSFLGKSVGDGATLLLTGEPGSARRRLDGGAEMPRQTVFGDFVCWWVEYETTSVFRRPAQLVDPLSRRSCDLPEPVARRSRLHLVAPALHPTCLAVLTRSAGAFSTGPHRAHPLLIVMTTCNWADRPAVLVVGFVGRRLRGSPIDFSVLADLEPALSSNAPGLADVRHPHRSRRSMRWTGWIVSSSTCRPVSDVRR